MFEFLGSAWEYIRSFGVTHNSRGPYGYTELHLAVFRDDPFNLKLLIDAGADLEAKDDEGHTALHIAAFGNSTHCLKALIDAEANIDATNHDGKTPLHIAAHAGRLDLICILFESKAKLDIQDNYGNTALHEAVYYGNIPQLNVLLESGINLEVKNFDGNTALHLAAEVGHPMYLYRLLAAGANRHATNNQGKTPAMIAAEHQHPCIDHLLENHGKQYSVYSADSEIETPTHETNDSWIVSGHQDRKRTPQFKTPELAKEHLTKHSTQFTKKDGTPLYQNHNDYVKGAHDVIRKGEEITYLHDGKKKKGYFNKISKNQNHFVSTNINGDLIHTSFIVDDNRKKKLKDKQVIK